MFSTIRKNYELYKKQYFRGNDIYCPFCSGFYKSQKFKLSKEQSSNCPVCSSTIEERTVLLFLLSKTRLLSGELSVLIISEPGIVCGYFENFPNAEVKVYKETGDFTIRDNTLKNKYDSDKFDLIVCNYILEKLPDHIAVLKEIKRILRPEGLIMLQANVDSEKDKTVELPLTNYKDRFMMYGIPGNHRRFGKDYADHLKALGLNVSRLRFTGGFDLLPEMSFKKEEVIYIAHKTPSPALEDNTDELEAEMAKQRSNSGGNRLQSLLYTLFFILPDILKNYASLVMGNLNEREENKGKFSYMIYILISGQFYFWLGLFLYVIFSSISDEFWFAGLFFLFTLGFGGALIMAGYVFLNGKAGFIKKLFVGAFLLVSLFYPLIGGFFR